MKVSNLKSAPPFLSYDWGQHGILTYGETNDFPESLQEILIASKTGNACVDIYNDFVLGHGFREKAVGKLIVNKKRQTLNKVLRIAIKDFTMWYGCAIHINYSGTYRVRSISVVPFEHCRLAKPDANGVVHEIKVHRDWGRRDRTHRFQWTPSEITTFPVFNPDPEVVAQQVEACGGWDNYRGQILYFSGSAEGELAYPIPKYIAEATDMRTEEGLANVTGRNVCSNFLLAGIVADIMETEQTKEQRNEKQAELQKFQGDTNTSQLWYTQVKNKDQVPVFVPFSGENYDKAFTATQSVVPNNIGEAFKQPPILRAKDVGANFGADLMTNAYKFYNSVTSRERMQLTEMFTDIFDYWWAPLSNMDFTIQALTYNAGSSVYERIGDNNVKEVMVIVTNNSLSLTQKRNSLRVLYGMTDEEIIKILPNAPEGTEETIPLAQAFGVGALTALMDAIADPEIPTETKRGTLIHIFGLSEDVVDELLNTNTVGNDTNTGGSTQSTTNSGKPKRRFPLANLFKGSRNTPGN